MLAYCVLYTLKVAIKVLNLNKIKGNWSIINLNFIKQNNVSLVWRRDLQLFKISFKHSKFHSNKILNNWRSRLQTSEQFKTYHHLLTDRTAHKREGHRRPHSDRLRRRQRSHFESARREPGNIVVPVIFIKRD